MNIIRNNSWFDIADHRFDSQAPQITESGIYHVDICDIPLFFSLLSSTTYKVVVVSSRSDYGLFYQRIHPPWRDLAKWVSLTQVPEWGYKSLPPEAYTARFYAEQVDPSDTFSIKCDAFTYATFDEIPPNVIRWYCVNNGITNNDRIVSIPFGTCEQFTVPTNFPSHRHGIYANWQFYTYKRMELWSKLDRLSKHMSILTVKQEVPHEEYINDLCSHSYILCPSSNGLDTQRVLESLYCGAVPVLEINELSFNFHKLKAPVIQIEDLIYAPFVNFQNPTPNNNWMDLDWWRLKIHNDFTANK